MLLSHARVAKAHCSIKAACRRSAESMALLACRFNQVPTCMCHAESQVKAKPVSNREVVDFGPGIGRRSCFLYHLPEVVSTHKCLGVPSVSARFSTAPEFWNLAMWLVARLAPASFLRDRDK